MKRMWLIVLLAILGALVEPAPVAADITVIWTAPGDDGNIGTAAAYELRYAGARISETNWASATPVTGLPAPAIAGTVQSFVITNLDPGRKLYLAMRSVDEAGNWSAVSNNAVYGTCDCLNARGNVDNDPYDRVNITDLTELIMYLFAGQTSVPCPMEADVTGDIDGKIDLVDLNLLIGFLYRSGDYSLAPCP